MGVAECSYELPSSPTLLLGEKGARSLVASRERARVRAAKNSNPKIIRLFSNAQEWY